VCADPARLSRLPDRRSGREQEIDGDRSDEPRGARGEGGVCFAASRPAHLSVLPVKKIMKGTEP
jgi:hypothetical protein